MQRRFSLSKPAPEGPHLLESALMAPRELEFVEWLRQQQRPSPVVRAGIGDDMAVVSQPSGILLLASDMLLDGVHFDSSSQPLKLIGRKAVACNLSDCAAMAVKPLAATVSVALPRGFSLDQGKQLWGGMAELAQEFELALVGGDTVSWDHPLALDVAISAVPYPGIEPVRRDGARVGDLLYVTGVLGGSRKGRHLTFQPRVNEAKALAENLGGRLHAMMDLSDGLALDLSRMCTASKVGAELDVGKLAQVVSADAEELARHDGISALEHALSDGEDFELLLAVDGPITSADISVHLIGVVTTETGMSLRQSDGRTSTLKPRGYQHW